MRRNALSKASPGEHAKISFYVATANIVFSTSCGLIYKKVVPGVQEDPERSATKVPYLTDVQDNDVDICAFTRVQIITITRYHATYYLEQADNDDNCRGADMVQYSGAQSQLSSQLSDEMMKELSQSSMQQLKVSVPLTSM
jgi:hypothetical protein